MQPSFAVLTDFSEAAAAALSYTTRLAQRVDGRLVLLNVYQDLLLEPEAAVSVAPVVLESRRQMMANLVRQADLVPLLAEASVSVDTVAAAVADIVRRRHPVLLVLARKYSESFSDRLLRNQALPILQDACYPLLLVPEGWTGQALPGRIVVAADEQPFRLTSASLALKKLLSALNPTTTIVHVAQAHGPSWGAAALEAVRLTGLFGPIANNSLYEVREETPADGILLAAADVQADILVLLARPHTFLGGLFHRSVTAEVMRRSPIPVLVLPTAA